MQWRPLTVIDCDSALPGKIRKRHAELVRRVADLEKSRADLDSRVRALSEGELTPAGLSQVNEVRSERLLLWQAETNLRQDYALWLVDVEPEYRRLGIKAEADRDAAEVDIRAKLVSIGFVDGPDAERDPSRVTPAMYLSHPSVRAQVQRASEISTLKESLENSRASNEIEGARTAGDVDAYRQKVMAAVA